MSKLTLEIEEEKLIDFFHSVLEGLHHFECNKLIIDKDNKKLIIILSDDIDKEIEWEIKREK